MTLVDTSVWVNHFRRTDATLMRLLADNLVTLHPFVLGEIAAGHLRNRSQTLGDLGFLRRAPLAQEAEVHILLESHRLWGTGLGRSAPPDICETIWLQPVYGRWGAKRCSSRAETRWSTT